MLVEKEKETRSAGRYSYGALQDIETKAERAVDENPAFFNDPAHIAKVAAVEAICKDYFASIGVMFTTARRPAPRAGRPYSTEVKVQDYVLQHKRDKKKFEDDLKAAGVQIIDPKAGEKISYSFYIW